MIRLLLSSILSEIKIRIALHRALNARTRYELSPAECRVSCRATGSFQRVYVGSARR